MYAAEPEEPIAQGSNAERKPSLLTKSPFSLAAAKKLPDSFWRNTMPTPEENAHEKRVKEAEDEKKADEAEARRLARLERDRAKREEQKAVVAVTRSPMNSPSKKTIEVYNPVEVALSGDPASLKDTDILNALSMLRMQVRLRL